MEKEMIKVILSKPRKGHDSWTGFIMEQFVEAHEKMIAALNEPKEPNVREAVRVLYEARKACLNCAAILDDLEAAQIKRGED